MMNLVSLGLVVLALLWIVKYWKRTNLVWNTLPGPSYKWPILGNFFEDFQSNVGEFHSENVKKYGPVFRYYCAGLVRVEVADPALIKHVFLNNYVFDKNLELTKRFGKILGDGLITQGDEVLHKYHRSIIAPAFAYNHLRALVPIFQRKSQILVEDWQKVAGNGKAVDIKEDIAAAASDVIGEAGFDFKLNAQRNDEQSIKEIFFKLGNIHFITHLLPITKYFFRSYYEQKQALKDLNSNVEELINQKIAARNSKSGETQSTEDTEEETRDHKDLLALMMDSQNEDGARLTREELMGQTKTLLLAGYDTSVTCMLWTLYHLAKDTEVQDKVAAEIRSVIGTDRQPTAEDIDKMPYLFKVLRESLRMYPPIPRTMRQAAEDTTIGGYTIPKGTHIGIHIWYQHNNPEVWKNPEVFDPERWTDDIENSPVMRSYFPFLMGARNCIGSKFAMLEIRVMLSMILQKLRVTRDPTETEEVKERTRVILVPNKTIRVMVNHRK